MTPKQRKPGQTGGYGGQRANKGTFRNAGGSVPPKKSSGAIFFAPWLDIPISMLGLSIAIWKGIHG